MCHIFYKCSFGSGSPTSSRADPLEGESSFGGTDYTGTPQLSNYSGKRLLQQAPSYIDPPPFKETIVHMRSRTQSANSAYSRDYKHVPEWVGKEGPVSPFSNSGISSHELFLSHNPNPNNNTELSESDNSIEKNTAETLSEVSDHTQYSHLAPTQSPTSTRPQHHHQVSFSSPLPLVLSNSTGDRHLPHGGISSGRLAQGKDHEQSPEAEITTDYDTYV